MNHASDRNLLFGILALQLDFIPRDGLVRGMNAWLLAKHQSLGDILVEQGMLAADARPLLEALVDKHLARHGGDSAQSLAAASKGSNHEDLAGIADPDVQNTLAHAWSASGAKDPHATASRVEDSPGRPRYQTLRPLASGGLGQVSVALDLELQREVVVKEILNRHADNPVTRQRFLVEARITGGLEHPGVVSVYGLCHSPEGRPYYAMRFIRGRSLKEEIEHYHQLKQRRRTSDRPLALRQLLTRFLDACNAVEYAHSRGILHRDLKPANIMLGAYGETLVVDWGLAKPFDTLTPAERRHDGPGPLQIDAADTTMTMMGTVVGTPVYMSPEQAGGQLDRLGPASDVYSLGATLFQVLTGQPPIAGTDTAAVLHKVRQGDFPSPRQLKRDIPRALEAICLKAMALVPAERYDSSRLLANDLELWLADEPTSVAKAESVWERSGRWFRRNRTVVTSVVALLVTAVVALGVSNAIIAEARNHAHEQFVQAESARRDAAESAKAEKLANQRLEQTLYFNRIALAESELSGSNVPRAEELLNACGAEKNSWEWRYLIRRTRARQPFLDVPDAERILTLAFSPAGNRVVTGSLNGAVRVLDVPSGKEIKNVRPAGAMSATGLSFAKDGRLAITFSTLRACSVQIFASSELAREVLSFAGPAGYVSHITFSPDGRWLALAGSGTAHLYDASTGKEVLVLHGHARPLRCVAFDAPGRRLATCGDDNTVRVWELPSGKLLHKLEGHIAEVLSVAFSPDDKKLASSSMDGIIRLWDSDNGAKLLELFADFGPIHEVAFHPDGTRLAAADNDRSTKLWDVATGQEVLTLPGHDDDVCRVAFSPDGHWLASGSWDGHVHLYDARPLSELPRYQLFDLEGHQRLVFAVSYQHDGRHFYSGGSDGNIHGWDAETGRHLSTLKGSAGMVVSLDVARDGKRLLSANANGNIQIWDLDQHRVTASYPNLRSAVWGAAFNHDATQFACISGFDGTLSIWDSTTGQEIRSSHAHLGGAFGVAYSPDGKYLATGGFDRTAKLFDAATGKLLHTFTGHANAIYRVAFSPDGKYLATASADRTARVWDLKTHEERVVFRGHADRVYTVAFSPVGGLVASAGADGLVKIWRAREGKEIVTLRGQNGMAFDADFSPDGRRLVSSGGFRESGDIKIWDFAAIVAEQR